MAFWNDGLSRELSDAEIEECARERIALLLADCARYDQEGLPREIAVMISVHLRVLLHDGTHSNSRSLLGSLGIRDSMEYYDSGDALNLKSRFGQSALTARDERGRHLPVIDWHHMSKHRPTVRFSEWWHQPIMLANTGETLSRDQLVRGLADTEGAHVDPVPREAFALFSRLNALGVLSGSNRTPLDSPVYAAGRQVAHEVLVSLALRRKSLFRDKEALDDLLNGRFSCAFVYGARLIMGNSPPPEGLIGRRDADAADPQSPDSAPT